MTLGRRIVLCFGVIALVVFHAERAETHKPITSKYTYNEDVFPIINERCGRCHAPGGVAPMSLLSYKDAVPWAEAIRGELLAANMPPWYGEPGYGELGSSHRLSAREIDVLLTWATGGTPQGAAQAPPAAEHENKWAMGPPDLVLPIAAEFTLSADKMEDTQEFVLQTGAAKDRWVRAADLLPGAPAIVRSALIYSRTSGTAEPNVLGVWLPGEDPVFAPGGAAFRVPAGASLAVRIHYRKTWKYEGEAVTDRSAVGLYLLDRPAERELQSIAVSSPVLVLSRNVQALAIRPDQSEGPIAPVRVEAVRPDGSRVQMAGLSTRPGWERRYWFAQPVALPRGTRILVTGTGQKADEAAPRLWLDFVSRD